MNKIIVEVGSTCTKVDKFDGDNIEKNDPFGFYALLDNQIIGGIIAHKKMQWLDIDILYVNENFRENKMGSHLINKAIEYCKEEELVGIHLYTLDFQAKGFYEKKGFKLIAEIKDWPKGITRYEFIKYIDNNIS